MTEKMKELFSNLSSIKVKNIVEAYDYIGNEINGMDMDGTYQYELTSIGRKNIMNEYKILRKHYKGKLQINPVDILNKYPEDTQEYFFLKCLVKLMEYNLL